MLQRSIRGVLLSTGEESDGAQQTLFRVGPLKPWRQDRKKLEPAEEPEQ